MLKVSIIVPVYNAEKTIDRCVSSLINQDYPNLEILLINDGSKDKSLSILRNYEKKYNNVKVLTHKNSGVGKTRNVGIREATGEYLTFVDSDDALAKDAISLLVRKIKENTDIVMGGATKKTEKDEIIYDIDIEDNLWNQLKYNCTFFKLYRKDFLIRNNIQYSQFKIAEDVYFCLSAFSKTKNVEVEGKAKYLHYYNEQSVTSTFKSEKNIYDILDVLKEIHKNLDLSKFPASMIQFFYIKTIVQNIIIQLDGISTNDLNQLFIKNYEWIQKEQIGFKKVKFHFQKEEDFSINMVVNLFILARKCRLSRFLIFILKKMPMIRQK